jgi:Flp pilus assembly pilin Flp
MDMRCIRRSVKRALGSWRSDLSGAVAVEYSLMVAMVVIIGCVSIYGGSLGQSLANTFQAVANGI